MDSPAKPGQPIIFFDGVCALCNGFVDFVLIRDKGDLFRFAALQGDTAVAVLNGKTFADKEDLRSVYLWDGQKVYGKSDAALRVLARLGGPWSFSRYLLAIPRFFRDGVYDIVAQNRYHWFGKHDTCRLPAADERERFLP